MKKFLVLFFCLATTLFSQWGSVVQTAIPFNTNYQSKIDVFTNNKGTHILVILDYPSSYLKYYLLNRSGQIVRSSTLENQSISFPNIDGDNDKVYVTYKMGDYLKIKKSTDVGQNWSDFSSQYIGSNTCSNIDVAFEPGKGLHLAYALFFESEDGESQATQETYYYLINFSGGWTDFKEVTDYGNEIGGYPTISYSQNRVHVSYNSGNGQSPQTNVGYAKSRDKYYNDWLDPQEVTSPSMAERIHKGISSLFDFYYKFESGMGNYHSDLYVTTRTFNGTSWTSGSSLLHQYSDPARLISVTNTVGKTHVVYPGINSVIYRNYNGGSWSSELTLGSNYYSPKISSYSNDLFVAWGGDQYVYFKLFDDAPAAPTDLVVTENANGHPYLEWGANSEQDFSYYKVYRWDTYAPDPELIVSSTTLSYYTDQSISFCHAVPPASCENERRYFYFIKAVDQLAHQSVPSEYFVVSLVGGPPYKIKVNPGDNSFNYEISQNYPNPFNPSTEIFYSLKNDGFVSVSVYDILGNRITSLVNENQQAGAYRVLFNASTLPSGMYICKIISGNFSKSIKMSLVK